jgi:hypothetical protein
MNATQQLIGEWENGVQKGDATWQFYDGATSVPFASVVKANRVDHYVSGHVPQ